MSENYPNPSENPFMQGIEEPNAPPASQFGEGIGHDDHTVETGYETDLDQSSELATEAYPANIWGVGGEYDEADAEDSIDIVNETHHQEYATDQEVAERAALTEKLLNEAKVDRAHEGDSVYEARVQEIYALQQDWESKNLPPQTPESESE